MQSKQPLYISSITIAPTTEHNIPNILSNVGVGKTAEDINEVIPSLTGIQANDVIDIIEYVIDY